MINTVWDLTMENKNTISVRTAIENTKQIFLTDSSITSLMNFERVLSEMDVYAYANWVDGELVEGPVYEKYYITCTFMWKYEKMPDPAGGERLLDYDCTVLYRKASLEYPIKVKTPDDFEAGTKMPKMKKLPVWLVEISIPKSLMDDVEQGSIELGSETIDVDDVEDSIESGIDDKSYDEEAVDGEVQNVQQ